MRAGEVKHRVRRPIAGALALALAGGLTVTGCSSSSPSDATTTTTVATKPDPSDASTTADVGSTTPTTTKVATPTTALPDASEAQRSAPGDGSGTALLKAVRIGRNDGFERIVFEFAGTSKPGYRIEWVNGPITADGSGDPVDVTGSAYLQMIMDPASGVDLSAPSLTVVYSGPDRIPTAGKTQLITDLVRTGDFEAVLSWVAGTGRKVPFRVLTLSSPTRVVVDLAT